MRILYFIAIATVALDISTALAQPAASQQPQDAAKSGFALPPESITVTVAKPSEETIKSFVETRAAPTRFLGKMARWRRGICPLTVGLGDKYAQYVTQRIRDVATAVGVPVNTSANCRPNIEVIFTTRPQDFMNNVRSSAPAFLGYYTSSDQADEMAKVTHPIQAWYSTESVDYNGNGQVDTAKCGGRGTALNVLPLQVTGSIQLQGFITIDLSCARVMPSTGFRINNGQDSGFYNALIIAEPAKLTDYEVGSLADYITVLALSQPASLDSCQELPSISNLLAKGCVSASSKITDGDLAYLKGLYSVPSGYGFSSQRDGMQYQMKKTLVTDKGG